METKIRTHISLQYNKRTNETILHIIVTDAANPRLNGEKIESVKGWQSISSIELKAALSLKEILEKRPFYFTKQDTFQVIDVVALVQLAEFPEEQRPYVIQFFNAFEKIKKMGSRRLPR